MSSHFDCSFFMLIFEEYIYKLIHKEMFYLRKIDRENGTVSNHGLGNTYVSEHRDLTKDFADKCTKVLDWMSKEDNDRVYGLIYGEHGDVVPLFRDSENYIMTDNGSTFERL